MLPWQDLIPTLDTEQISKCLASARITMGIISLTEHPRHPPLVQPYFMFEAVRALREETLKSWEHDLWDKVVQIDNFMG